MIKQDELEKIQDKYKNLENELNQSVMIKINMYLFQKNMLI